MHHDVLKLALRYCCMVEADIDITMNIPCDARSVLMVFRAEAASRLRRVTGSLAMTQLTPILGNLWHMGSFVLVQTLLKQNK